MSDATSSRSGDSQTLESKLLMHRITRQDTATLRGNPIAILSSEVSSVVDSMEKSSQSHPDSPIIVSKQLKESHGDRVKIDQLHEYSGMPVMGERNAAGREEGRGRSQFGLRIDYTRKPVYSGSTMAQQRRGYPLKMAARAGLDDWWKRYSAQLTWSHLGGARGTFNGADLILPPTEPVFNADGDPMDEMSEAYVNNLMPPTADRRFFAGSATSISHTANPLQPTDTMTLATLKRVAVRMETMDYPLGAAQFQSSDLPAGTDPFHVGFMTPEQYADVEASDPNFQTLVAQSKTRVNGWNHPIFKSDGFMLNNIWWTKYYCPIRWSTGDTVHYSEDDNAATRQDDVVPNNVEQVDRAIVLGKYALCLALAGDSNGVVFKTDEDDSDYNDKNGICLKWMGGMRKIRQFTKDNKAYDTGVLTIDSVTSKAA